MIEQYVSEKQCRKCMQCKPRTEFSPENRRQDGLHQHCKACRRDYANRRTAECVRSDYTPKRQPLLNPTAWLIPADPRDFRQKLMAATQRRWQYEVEPANNLVASLGAAA